MGKLVEVEGVWIQALGRGRQVREGVEGGGGGIAGLERHLEGALEQGEGQGRYAEGAEGWVGALGRG